MSNLYYTRTRIDNVARHLRNAGWTVTQNEEHQSERSKSYTVTRTEGSTIDLYWTEGCAPLFSFRHANDADANDSIFNDLFCVRRAKRFG